MKALLILVTMSLCMMPQGHAQEGVALTGVENQATWSALSNLVTAANNKATEAQNRANAMEACTRQGRIYSPNTANADANGCAASEGDMTLANNLAACFAIGKMFNGSQCIAAAVEPVVVPPVCRTETKTVGACRRNESCGSGWTTISVEVSWCGKQQDTAFTRSQCMRVVCS